MSRIRSVHPGLFTDECFMAASPHARVLMIGLWTEADDQGVFEWKPLTIKARLLPVDAVDIVELLDELVSLDSIRRFEDGGKSYGAVRNFRKYQRPQKPSYHHPLPDDVASYVGLSPTSTVPVRDEYDSATVKSLQMEDGGGRKEESTSSLRSDVVATAPKETPQAALETVLPPELAAAVIAHRRAIRKPLTVHAARLLGKKLTRCRDGPEAAANCMVENGWQGFEPSWYEDRKRGHNGHGQGTTTADIARQFADYAEGRGDDPGQAVRMLPRPPPEH